MNRQTHTTFIQEMLFSSRDLAIYVEQLWCQISELLIVLIYSDHIRIKKDSSHNIMIVFHFSKKACNKEYRLFSLLLRFHHFQRFNRRQGCEYLSFPRGSTCHHHSYRVFEASYQADLGCLSVAAQIAPADSIPDGSDNCLYQRQAG